MRCPTCYGGTEFVPCVCATEAEMANTPELTLDERWLLAPRDPRDEYRSPEDFTLPEWSEGYES
jgi:hypothetical protein